MQAPVLATTEVNGLKTAAEAAVVALAAAGNGAAFDELVRRKQGGVRALMRRLSRDAGVAEDLAQQVFVEVWKSLRRLSATAAFNGWLRRIAVNVWLQHARRSDTMLRNLSDPLDDAFDAVGALPADGSAIDLAATLALLPAPARLCIVLAYQEGMSHGDVAALTGIPVGTVKSHIARGSARLRILLSDYESAS